MSVCVIRSDQISKRQSQIDRLYVSLKDLVEERKCRLEQQYWLFQLHREVEELEQWIAEREISASSTELGQDYEHVTVRTKSFLRKIPLLINRKMIENAHIRDMAM